MSYFLQAQYVCFKESLILTAQNQNYKTILGSNLVINNNQRCGYPTATILFLVTLCRETLTQTQ